MGPTIDVHTKGSRTLLLFVSLSRHGSHRTSTTQVPLKAKGDNHMLRKTSSPQIVLYTELVV